MGSLTVAPEGSIVVGPVQVTAIKAHLREAINEAEKVEKSAAEGTPWTARTHRLKMIGHLRLVREVFE